MTLSIVHPVARGQNLGLIHRLDVVVDFVIVDLAVYALFDDLMLVRLHKLACDRCLILILISVQRKITLTWGPARVHINIFRIRQVYHTV